MFLLETGNWELETTRDSPLHTACAFVVGKNYRLQDIQLSKMREALSRPLSAFGRLESPTSRPRRFVVTASFPNFGGSLAGQLSRPVRAPELSILRTPRACCKRDRRKTF
jgi:hypothetical protein